MSTNKVALNILKLAGNIAFFTFTWQHNITALVLTFVGLVLVEVALD